MTHGGVTTRTCEPAENDNPVSQLWSESPKLLFETDLPLDLEPKIC